MKKLILTAAALLIAVGAHAQGYFAVNTRASSTSLIKFLDAGGTPLSGSDYFVQVFAGPDANNLTPLADPFALTRTGTSAGLTNPFNKTFNTALAGGTTVTVGYAAFQGSSWATATAKSPIITKADAGAGAALTVQLVEAPNLPNTVVLGNGTVSLVPEPATLALGLIGLGTLLAFRRRQ